MASCSSSFCSSVMSACVFLLMALLIAAAAQAEDVVVVAGGGGGGGGGDVVLPACKTVGGGSAYFDVTFCVEALGASSNSTGHARGYRGLAAVAVGLLAANATSTAAKIDGLLREGGGRGAKENAAVVARCLRSCRVLYGGIVGRGPACATAVKGRRFAEATANLERSAAAARECEEGFRKSNAASPVTAEGDDAFKLAKLAVALLRFA